MLSSASPTLATEVLDLIRFEPGRELVVPAIKMGAALLLGGLIGIERERVRETAGLRTHVIVALSAAAMTAGSLGAGMSADSQSRVVQGILQGIGFLGAGTIIQRGGERGGVRGLTTASTVWLVAVIGALCGMGELALAFLATAVAWVVLVPLKRIEHRWEKSREAERDGRRNGPRSGGAGLPPSIPPSAP